MSAAVSDTHAVVWYLTSSNRLSTPAIAAFDAAAHNGEPIWVPSICLVELTYLTERHRIPSTSLRQLRESLLDPTAVLRLAPLDWAVTEALGTISREIVPDMPDRIIAATAAALNLPLITRDARLRSLSIATIW